MTHEQYVVELMGKANAAQAVLENYSQEQVDTLCASIVYNATRPEFAKRLAEFAVEESGMGRADHKYGKIMVKGKGTLRDMKGEKSVGIVEVDDAKGMIKIAKPMGVIAALVPVTNCEATPIVKAIAAIKGRNAIVMAPHPRTKNTNVMIIDNIRETLKRHGAPEDLVIAIAPDQVSIETSNILMEKADFVLATGGSGMVHAAYSSGTPAIGVGVGNASTIVDGTTSLSEAADKIMRSKIFDHATSCSAENSCIVHEDVYEAFIKELQNTGAKVIRDGSEDKEKLINTIWVDGHLNRDIVAQSPEKIGTLAGFEDASEVKYFVVEETGIGADYPLSGEKLSVVMTLYKYKRFEDAVGMVNDIMHYQGLGHSCGIHTTDQSKVLLLSKNVKASRIMVNQPQCLANSGAWTNGMPMTMSLGCSTWGGNSVSHNVTWKDLVNFTYVSHEIPSTEPTDEELFGADIIAANA